jgi:hypothetical protein
MFTATPIRSRELLRHSAFEVARVVGTGSGSAIVSDYGGARAENRARFEGARKGAPAAKRPAAGSRFASPGSRTHAAPQDASPGGNDSVGENRGSRSFGVGYEVGLVEKIGVLGDLGTMGFETHSPSLWPHSSFCGTWPTCALRIAARSRHDGGHRRRRDDPRNRTRRERHDCGVGSRRMRLNSRPRREAD